MRRLRLRCGRAAVKVWRIVAIGLLVAAMATACGGVQATPTTTPSGITVTFEGDQCVYHGPARVPGGRIPVILDVRDQTAHELYGVGVATLDEGKTAEDLLAYPSTANPPLWLHDHGGVDAAQGTSQEATVVLFEGPLFLVCFAGEELTDALGPIEIEPAVSK